MNAKLRYLEAFAEQLHIPIEQCVCVGDGANDRAMFDATGHGITFTGSAIESSAWKVIDSLQELKSIF
jgi:phosphoserine phosphatase